MSTTKLWVHVSHFSETLRLKTKELICNLRIEIMFDILMTSKKTWGMFWKDTFDCQNRDQIVQLWWFSRLCHTFLGACVSLCLIRFLQMLVIWSNDSSAIEKCAGHVIAIGPGTWNSLPEFMGSTHPAFRDPGWSYTPLDAHKSLRAPTSRARLALVY